MRISTAILMAAFMFGASTVSAQSAGLFAGESILKNQTVSSVAAGEINQAKKFGGRGRGHRCPEFCS
jgi:hypothetical protein